MTEPIDIVDESDDDDILKDLFMETNDDDDDNKNPLDSEEAKTLKEALAEKDKQINGLLQTVKSDRRKRQEMKGQLDQVTTTINSLLEQKNELQTLTPGESSAKATVEGIPVEFDDDGNAFIPQDKLDALLEPQQNTIQETQEALLLTAQQQQQSEAAQRAIAQMVGKDERYTGVYSKYQNARKWVNDRVVDYQLDNNINGAFTSGQAMSQVFRDENMQREFAQLYPEFTLADVATAEDSEWHFETMLSNTANKLTDLKQPDERFRKVMSKPSGLGKSANARGGELTLAEKVASLSATDLMNLPEQQLEALQKYLQEEEQRDGITF
jgi:hypothetical protein